MLNLDPSVSCENCEKRSNLFSINNLTAVGLK